MLDARTGASLATTTVGHTPVAIAADETYGRAFTLSTCIVSLLNPQQECRNEGSYVSVLDLHSDTLLGTVSLGSGATALAVDERTGRVFVTSFSRDTVSVLDAGSGHLLSTVDLGGAPEALAVNASLQHVFISTLNPSGGRSSVSMLDGRTGALMATTRVGRYVGSILSDEPAERVLVASEGDVYLLDARSGQTLRRIKDGGLPLAVDERDGYALLSGQGYPRFISTRDGTLVGRVAEHGALDAHSIEAVAVDEVVGRLYVATSAGILVLDGRNGRLLRTLTLSQVPLEMVADAAAHRVFILNSSAEVPTRPDSDPPLVRWLRRTLPWLPLPAAPPTTEGGTLTVLDTARL
jgi:DNA-binding beta-propeller fold protein YncE